MSHLLARIMLALLMLPMAAVVYTIGAVLLTRDVVSDEETMFIVVGIGACLFVGLYWTALWWRSVRWTRRRARLTAAVTGGALGIAVVLAWVIGSLQSDDFGCFIWAPLAICLWVGATVFVWRETKQERSARLGGRDTVWCPRCGYNMTGLRQSTCPECGAAYTIEELLAEQPQRQGDELVTAAGPHRR